MSDYSKMSKLMFDCHELSHSVTVVTSLDIYVLNGTGMWANLVGVVLGNFLFGVTLKRQPNADSD